MEESGDLFELPILRERRLKTEKAIDRAVKLVEATESRGAEIIAQYQKIFPEEEMTLRRAIGIMYAMMQLGYERRVGESGWHRADRDAIAKAGADHA